MRLLEVIKTHYKAFLVGIVVLALVITGIIIAIDAAKTAKINLLVTPVDAVIKIDGHKYQNGQHRVFPGKKHVEISREGMKTVSFDIDCESGHITAVNRYLVGEDDSFSFYAQSAESYELLTLLADEKVADFVNAQEQKLTIKDLLPISETRMIANHGFSKDKKPYIETKITNATDEDFCHSSICLKIKTNATNAEKTASELLKSYGYNLSDFEVKYE